MPLWQGGVATCRHSFFSISLVFIYIFSALYNVFTFFVAFLYSFTMSSSSTPITKNTNAVSQTPSPSQSQSSSTTGAESYPQRRSGGSGSFGAGSASRTSLAAARNSQSSRKQHKGQRRPRLADEDAAAESVSFCAKRLGFNKRIADMDCPIRRRCNLPAVGKDRPQ